MDPNLSSQNERGFTLVSALVGLTIFSIVVGAVLHAVSGSSTLMKNQRYLLSKSRIAGNVSRMAAMPASIRASLRDGVSNAELRQCVYGGAGKCLADGVHRPVRLNLPFISELPNGQILASGIMTGTPSNPIRYNDQGEICDPETEPCAATDWPIEVFTEFSSICPPIFSSMYDDDLRGGSPYYGPIYPNGLALGSQCDYAWYIKVRVTIRDGRGGVTATAGTTLPSMRPVIREYPVHVALVRGAF